MLFECRADTAERDARRWNKLEKHKWKQTKTKKHLLKQFTVKTHYTFQVATYKLAARFQNFKSWKKHYQKLSGCIISIVLMRVDSTISSIFDTPALMSAFYSKVCVKTQASILCAFAYFRSTTTVYKNKSSKPHSVCAEVFLFLGSMSIWMQTPFYISSVFILQGSQFDHVQLHLKSGSNFSKFNIFVIQLLENMVPE